MRKTTLFTMLCTFTFPVLSQSLPYQDLAVLFSKENNTGTARFNAMSGAFGALGGDISAIKINPAGAVVFKNSSFSSSVNIRNTDIKSTYYGESNKIENSYFNFSQIGVVYIIDDYGNSDWTKFAFSFNYNIHNDFRNNFTADGNSGFASFDKYPPEEEPKTQYNNAELQRFTNTYEGEISEYSFAISSVYQDDLYLGVAINTFDLKFKQYSILEEQNNDGEGDFLDAELRQTNSTLGTGFSLSAGVIYKAIKGLRLGLSYQTPIWFTEINEESNVVDNDGFYGKTRITVGSDSGFHYDNYNDYSYNEFSYKLRTPGKITTSFAYIFGSNGLISIDYIYKNFRKIKLPNSDFSDENKDFSDELRNTNTINFGTEWRFKALSLRGGYHYEQSPYKNAISTENIKRYSLGAGYKFGNIKLDFAYQNDTHTDIYNFYPEYDEVNAADLNIDNSLFTATLTLGF